MQPEIFQHAFGNGHAVQYQRLPSGTCYHTDTPESLVALLEQLRHNRRKVRLYYGDPTTGQSWLDEHDVIGWIGRSTGTIKVPLLIEPGDIGGPALLDHCIVRIDSPRQVLYQHGDFRIGEVELVSGELNRLPWEIWIDGSVHARFKAKTEARQYRDFIQGKRFAMS